MIAWIDLVGTVFFATLRFQGAATQEPFRPVGAQALKRRYKSLFTTLLFTRTLTANVVLAKDKNSVSQMVVCVMIGVLAM